MPETGLKKGWQRRRFDEMAAIVNDRIDNPSEAGVERYVGLEHLDSDSLTIQRWGSPSDVEATKLLFRKGDIIFGRRRVYQRKLAVADFDGICSAHAMVLRARSNIVLPEFLPFFMQTDLFMERARQISVGSLSPTINWKTLAEQEFALPPPEEQSRIVLALQAVSESLDRAATLVRTGALMESAFLRSQIPSTTSRAGGLSLPPDAVAQGWEIRSVKELGTVIRGSSPRPKGDPRYYGGPVPRVMVQDINRDGMYVTPSIDSLTVEGAKQSRPVPAGTLVMVCSGNVGSPSILTIDACIHDGILAVTELSKRVSSEYLYYAFRRKHREFLRLTTNGGIWSNLTTDVLKDIQIPVPPPNSMVSLLMRLRSVSAMLS